jgi:exonuclease, DNA polymerase III, epsilon subunit family
MLTGNYLFEDIDCYVCVDLETTGLNPQNDAIIEIGAVRVEKNEIVDTFQTLVNPGYRIPAFITQLTGITTQMVADAPDIETALGDFLEFAGNSRFVGHNIHCFDIKFICSKAERYLGKQVLNDYFDTLRLARRLYPEERHNRLCDLIERFNIAEREEHRALADALQTVECLNYMKRLMEDRNITFDDIRPGKPRHEL